jgi:signal transduction histidine kinase
MSKTAEVVRSPAEPGEKSRYLSRFRPTDRAAPVNIAGMEEPIAATELDSSHARTQVRAESIGQLGAQFAHDFNNVLAVALTSVEMAMRVGDPAKANVFLANALKVIARGRTLTDRLAAASYACETASNVDAHAVIERLVGQVRLAAPRGVRIISALEAARPTITIDAGFFEEAVRNLLANAIDALGGHGALTISTRNAGGGELRAEAGREYLVVAVHDTGRGMSDEVRHQAFDLFFSTGSAEAQRGIGLAQTKDAVRRAGGVSSIESAVGQGTTVTLGIPLADG